MIVPVMAISNLVLTQQIYSEETSVAHAHYREPVLLRGKRPQETRNRKHCENVETSPSHVETSSKNRLRSV